MANDFYDLTKRAFQECLDLVGVPISFAGIEKRCVGDRIYDKSDWQTVGFLPQETVTVQMLDDDFDVWATAGVTNAQASIVFRGIQFQLISTKSDQHFPRGADVEADRKDPTVELYLSISK